MKALELCGSLQSAIKNLYFVKGEDYYLRSLAFNAFKKLIDKDLTDFNYAVKEWDEDVKSLIADCNTMPFMSEKKVVAVKNCQKAGKASVAALAAYAKEPCESTILVLELFDESFKEIYPFGELVDCNKLDSRTVVKLITDTCAARGAAIDYEAANKIAVMSNFDMNSVSVKLEKLFAYCYGGTITVEAVNQMVAPEAEMQIFELTRAITQGANNDVVVTMKNLLSRGEKPSFILSNLSGQYRRMLHALLSDASDPELASYFGVKPYAITSARNLARKYTQVELKRAVDKLTDLEYGFKSGRFTEDDALKFAIAYLLKKEG